MTQIRHCSGCGAELKPNANFCDQCGLPCKQAEPFQAVNLLKDQTPTTIEELKQYCDLRGMPLEKMRFFIGVDCSEARAFGIYEEDGRFIVYKNKEDGSRAVRYHGPDEAYAVNEIYQKLLSECHSRGIYPENYGKPGGMRHRSASDAGTNRSSSSHHHSHSSHRKKRKNKTKLIIGIFLAVVIIGAIVFSWSAHRHDGYYRYNDNYYYRYGDSWYISYGSGSWSAAVLANNALNSAYYLGSDYAYDWGIGDFKDSSAWDDLHESRSNDNYSNDYDWDTFGDWDTGGTDWSSDW